MAVKKSMCRNPVSLDDINFPVDCVKGVIHQLNVRQPLDAKLSNNEVLLFTAQAKGFICLGLVRCTSAVSITVSPTGSFSIVPGAGDIYPDGDLGLMASMKSYKFEDGGTWFDIDEGDNVYYKTGTGATGTSMLIEPYVFGSYYALGE